MSHYSQLVSCVSEWNLQLSTNYVPLPDGDDEMVTTAWLDFAKWLTTTYFRKKKNGELAKTDDRIPDGHWYMFTVTSPAGSPESNVMSCHEKIMSSHYADCVYLASLEKTSNDMYHIHYVFRFDDERVRNHARDIKKLCSPRVCRFEKKANNLKKFQGMCKYVMKLDYIGDSTHVRFLVQRIDHVDGKGYVLRT